MKVTRLGIILGLILLIFLPVTAEQDGPKESAKETKTMKSYSGKVEPMGMSMFMQGSHQLVDDKGDMIFILQAGGEVNLSKFEGKNVTVEGTVEDTVEAGGKLMTVESIK